MDTKEIIINELINVGLAENEINDYVESLPADQLPVLTRMIWLVENEMTRFMYQGFDFDKAITQTKIKLKVEGVSINLALLNGYIEKLHSSANFQEALNARVKERLDFDTIEVASDVLLNEFFYSREEAEAFIAHHSLTRLSYLPALAKPINDNIHQQMFLKSKTFEEAVVETKKNIMRSVIKDFNATDIGVVVENLCLSSERFREKKILKISQMPPLVLLKQRARAGARSQSMRMYPEPTSSFNAHQSIAGPQHSLGLVETIAFYAAMSVCLSVSILIARYYMRPCLRIANKALEKISPWMPTFYRGKEKVEASDKQPLLPVKTFHH